MVKLEQGDNSSSTFKINGVSYNKGSYDIIYGSKEVDSNKDLIESSVEIGLKNFLTGERIVSPVLVNSWSNSLDVPYSTLSDLLLDIGSICINTNVELTQAEYDALTPVDGVTYYIID